MGHEVWSNDSRMREFQLNGTEDDAPPSYVFSERVNRRRRTWRMFMSMGTGAGAEAPSGGRSVQPPPGAAATAARSTGLACGDQPVMGHLRPSGSRERTLCGAPGAQNWYREPSAQPLRLSILTSSGYSWGEDLKIEKGQLGQWPRRKTTALLCLSTTLRSLLRNETERRSSFLRGIAFVKHRGAWQFAHSFC
ncbi:hypothetical protein V5799_017417 [Amblyomma americanum]|uniref:Uncharacterized protein n=1 Tax=Amblyomma americanum TaxID=6943 RepID=A0AAQ4F3C4_AMBAM